MREGLFIFFGILTILGALGVVFSRRAVFSALSLVFTFFALASLYVLWGSPFMGMLQILVYTGAIVVLFVFVVMLLQQEKLDASFSYSGWVLPVGLATVWVFALILLRTLNRGDFRKEVPSGIDTKAIAELLFSTHLWPFEILSVFLLALIITACVIAKPDRRVPNE